MKPVVRFAPGPTGRIHIGNLRAAARRRTLSKRRGSLKPFAVLSHSAVTGASHAVARNKSLNALASPSDSDKLSRAQTRFDIDELKSLNAKFRQELGYGEVATRLKAANIGGGEAFGNAVRGNLCVFDDVKRWWAIVSGEITPEIEAGDVRAAALSAKAGTLVTWGDGIGAVKKSRGQGQSPVLFATPGAYGARRRPGTQTSPSGDRAGRSGTPLRRARLTDRPVTDACFAHLLKENQAFDQF
jgi:hypothetical protein